MKKKIGIILFIIILITGIFYACSTMKKKTNTSDEVVEVADETTTLTQIVTTAGKNTTPKATTITTITTSVTTIETSIDDVTETYIVTPAYSLQPIETQIVETIPSESKKIEDVVAETRLETINTTAQVNVAVGYRPIDKLSVDLQNHIYNLCVENGVEFSIVMAIIEKESGFNSSASNGVCVGLMQLHSSYNAGDLYDPYHNTTLGIQLIGRLVTTYGLSQGLVYYNCGEYSGVYAPTSYSNSIIAAAEKYK